MPRYRKNTRSCLHPLAYAPCRSGPIIARSPCTQQAAVFLRHTRVGLPVFCTTDRSVEFSSFSWYAYRTFRYARRTQSYAYRRLNSQQSRLKPSVFRPPNSILFLRRQIFKTDYEVQTSHKSIPIYLPSNDPFRIHSIPHQYLYLNSIFSRSVRSANSTSLVCSTTAASLFLFCQR
jgi:hypothetical protein